MGRRDWKVYGLPGGVGKKGCLGPGVRSFSALSSAVRKSLIMALEVGMGAEFRIYRGRELVVRVINLGDEVAAKSFGDDGAKSIVELKYWAKVKGLKFEEVTD